MTSASELFHNRRYRFGRNSDSNFDAVSDIPSSITHRRHHSRGRDRLENVSNSSQERETGRIGLGWQQFGSGNVNVSDSGNHSSNVRGRSDRIGLGWQQFGSGNVNVSDSGNHGSNVRGRSDRIGLGWQQFGSGNVNISDSGNHGSNVRGRSRLSPNERLPGAVLLARERLLQRLRSVTLSGSRRSNRSSSSNHHNNIVTSDDFRFVDAAHWETVLSSEWLAAITPLTESVDHNITKRSPGLTQEAVNCLHVDIFYNPKEDDTSKALRECSICLESFLEGDELACLPCGHRYHFCCLEPWVRTCGDCPYCRRGINISNGGK